MTAFENRTACMAVSQFITLLKGIFIASNYWQLGIRLLQIFKCNFLVCLFCSLLVHGRKFSTYLGKYRGARLLDCVVGVHSAL